MRPLTRIIFSIGLLVALFGAQSRANAAIDIQEVKSPAGITAWLVEDYTVPLIALQFSFEGGSAQDPEGKEGLANLMSGLFDEGAGELDSDEFQERMDEVGLEMRFSADMDAVKGSVRLLSEQQDSAFELVRLAVNAPRFDETPFKRIRDQILSGIKARERDPLTEAQKKWADALYGDHPYARRDEGTVESLANINMEDVEKQYERLFAREGLHVAIVGAIDAMTAGKILDRIFGDLPAETDLVPVDKVDEDFGKKVHIVYDLPQTNLQLAWPGVERKDPDFFAAYIMNHILGGGSFSSRLYTEIREKRGLAYSVDSYIVNLDNATSLRVSTATRADRAAESLALIRDVVDRMAAEGPTEEELEKAKKMIIGSYAVSNLVSSSAIASTLVELQVSDLGIDYIARRDELISAVTLEDTRKIAARLFSVEPSVMIIGPQ